MLLVSRNVNSRFPQSSLMTVTTTEDATSATSPSQDTPKSLAIQKNSLLTKKKKPSRSNPTPNDQRQGPLKSSESAERSPIDAAVNRYNASSTQETGYRVHIEVEAVFKRLIEET
ncbi:hypothetical protein CC80DRAFT_551196 [Byssothecium circinans]|uniref:Uncharacterized protein n=1 Tax=Byssothecium circinans TaxID=147558 RepID=A0A6A5TMC3_9PLEO|nr:hypothetical protein CC80DRAFT_551196 [Byssothecium circinans]